MEPTFPHTSRESIGCEAFPRGGFLTFEWHLPRRLVYQIFQLKALIKRRALLTSNADIHLKNVLIKRTDSLDHLSIREYHEVFGKPNTEAITREDGLPLTSNIPPVATLSYFSNKRAKDVTIEDAQNLVLSDFGESFRPLVEQRLGSDSHTPLQSRPPEAFFEPTKALSFSADVWSLGTAIWEILGMKRIFNESVPPNELVAQQIATLGREHMPSAWQEIWDRPQNESSSDDLLPHPPSYKCDSWPPLEQSFEERVQDHRRRLMKYGIYDQDETSAILALMRSMLKLDPTQRITVDEVLQSEWMVKWALPELQKESKTEP